MICIRVKQVCTVLWLHFHRSWELSAKSEKEAFVLPLSLPTLFLEVCLDCWHPQGETFSLLPSPPELILDSRSQSWWVYMAQNWEVTQLHSGQRRVFSWLFFSLRSKGVLLSVTIKGRKRNHQFAQHLDPEQGALNYIPYNRYNHPHKQTPLYSFYSWRDRGQKRPCHPLKVTVDHDWHWVRAAFFRCSNHRTTWLSFGNECSVSQVLVFCIGFPSLEKQSEGTTQVSRTKGQPEWDIQNFRLL